MSVLIIGTVAFDELITPFGNSGKIIGGSGTYAALSASHFGESLGIVSIVGADFPQAKLDLMETKGIDTSGIEVVANGQTFFWKGEYHNDMNTRDTLETQLNVLMEFDPVVPEAWRSADFLMLGNLTPSAQMKVLNQMEKRPSLVVMDTMNFWMDNALPELKEVLKKVDVLTINDEEARQLSGEYSLVKAAQVIRAMGPQYLIIKKGEHGALLFGDKQIFFAPALPLEEVFDPTGAGDSFAGGFLGFLAAQKRVNFESMKQAVIYGSAMASFCVEKFGTERIINLDKAEIKARVQAFVDLVQFDLQFEA